jgi:hypothetical protein
VPSASNVLTTRRNAGAPASTLPPVGLHDEGDVSTAWREGTTAVGEAGGGSSPASRSDAIPIVPHADVPDGAGLLVHVRAVLDGSSVQAQALYAKFIQEYAERLASESARQEASARAPGAKTTEITESVVIRARESLDQQTAERQRPANLWEAAALAGMPMLSGAAGVIGNNLHSPWQWTLFALSALGAVICILYLLKRRLL